MKGYEFSNDGLSEAIIKNDKEAVTLFLKADININLKDVKEKDFEIKEKGKKIRALEVTTNGQMIFTCKDVPTNNLTINIVRMEVA